MRFLNLFSKESGKTDYFTRMLRMYGLFKTLGLNEEQEKWLSINDNELKLYKTTAELSIIINRFASMFSNGIFVVKDYKTEEIIENHELLKLLEKPNAFQNRNEFLKDIAINMCVYGNSIIKENRGSALKEFPSTLFPLPTSEVKIKQKKFNYWEATEKADIIEKYILDNWNTSFEPNEVIHLRHHNPEDIVVGLSPLHALQMPITNIRGSYGYRNVNIMKKGANGLISPKTDPTGIIPLEGDDRLEIEKQFKDTHGIFDNQSPIKFAKMPVDYTSISLPIKDSMLFEEVTEDTKRIIDAFGLNQNIFIQSTFNNVIEGLRMSYQDGIIPFAELVCFGLNDSLDLFNKGIYVELTYDHLPVFKEDEMLKANATKTKAEAMEKLVNLGYTIDEAKIVVGL